MSALRTEAFFFGSRLRRQEVLERLTEWDGVTAASRAVAGLEGAIVGFAAKVLSCIYAGQEGCGCLSNCA